MTQREKEIIWETVMGFRSGKINYENLFEEGSECLALCEKIYACEDAVAERLGVCEVREIQHIERYFNHICRIVSLRMFDYGVKHGMRLQRKRYAKRKTLR